MPKPLFGDNGSGMHTHISIWKDGSRCLPATNTPASPRKRSTPSAASSNTAGPCAPFTNPTTNSYKRLVPGFEAPVNLAYSSRNRSAAIRIPMYSSSPKAKRVEFRTPDPSCNGYLAFSAMLMAVIDGIENKIDPGDPLDKNIYDLPPEELAEIESAPGSLEEALAALAEDNEFLLKGDVFTEDVIESGSSTRRKTRSTPSN
jgi:glutamine synthetase